MAGVLSASRVLITGASGQVGAALVRALAPAHEIFAPAREQLELANPRSIRKVMREVQPRWVVNAAAYTAVDKAESEPEVAFAINAGAPGIFAEEARSIGAVVIHFSTDYVFDGAKTTPYVESDSVGPLNVYGSSKVAGEAALESSGIAHLTFRTSWIYGATGNNFLRSILRLARERPYLRIVADQHGAPTWSFELARMTAYVINHFEAIASQAECSLQEAALPVSGIYHASSGGETTWYDFAVQAIAEVQERQPDFRLATVEPILTAAYPTPAKRPINSLLDCAKLEEVFQWRMPDWQRSLSLVLAELVPC